MRLPIFSSDNWNDILCHDVSYPSRKQIDGQKNQLLKQSHTPRKTRRNLRYDHRFCTFENDFRRITFENEFPRILGQRSTCLRDKHERRRPQIPNPLRQSFSRVWQDNSIWTRYTSWNVSFARRETLIHRMFFSASTFALISDFWIYEFTLLHLSRSERNREIQYLFDNSFRNFLPEHKIISVRHVFPGPWRASLRCPWSLSPRCPSYSTRRIFFPIRPPPASLDNSASGVDLKSLANFKTFPNCCHSLAEWNTDNLFHYPRRFTVSSFIYCDRWIIWHPLTLKLANTTNVMTDSSVYIKSSHSVMTTLRWKKTGF